MGKRSNEWRYLCYLLSLPKIILQHVWNIFQNTTTNITGSKNGFSIFSRKFLGGLDITKITHLLLNWPWLARTSTTHATICNIGSFLEKPMNVRVSRTVNDSMIQWVLKSSNLQWSNCFGERSDRSTHFGSSIVTLKSGWIIIFNNVDIYLPSTEMLVHFGRGVFSTNLPFGWTFANICHNWNWL